jgi:predicted lipoprotein
MNVRRNDCRLTIAVSAAWVASLSFPLSSCVPWTTRPIEDTNASSSAEAPFDARSYVDAQWAPKLLPAVLDSAVEARVLLDALAASPDAAGRKYGHREGMGEFHFAVKGEGRVVAVDTRSRVGLLLVDVAPFDNRPDVSIQTGPVLRGSSLRDFTGLVRFTDFANQLEFADVGNELNDRVLATVLAGVDLKNARGRSASFAGTFSLGDAGQPPIHEVVPVSLKLEDRR